MTGNEDTSVLQYKSSHPTFPHEPTGDQFYGEDQFESYRHLGRDIALEAFATDAPQWQELARGPLIPDPYSPQFPFMNTLTVSRWGALRPFLSMTSNVTLIGTYDSPPSDTGDAPLKNSQSTRAGVTFDEVDSNPAVSPPTLILHRYNVTSIPELLPSKRQSHGEGPE